MMLCPFSNDYCGQEYCNVMGCAIFRDVQYPLSNESNLAPAERDHPEPVAPLKYVEITAHPEQQIADGKTLWVRFGCGRHGLTAHATPFTGQQEPIYDIDCLYCTEAGCGAKPTRAFRQVEGA